MPIDDYTQVASTYANKFNGQARTLTSAAVNSLEQIDRDNLLHFIEANFQTGVKGGVSVENLRAVLHAIIKSTSNISDDDTTRPIFARTGRIYSGASNRYYYGSSTSGYQETVWSSYTTSLSNLSAAGSSSAFKMPYDIYQPTLSGTISKQNGTAGDVEIHLYYSDQDDGSSVYLANPTLIGSKTVTLSALNTVTDYIVTPNSAAFKVPAGKMIWVLVRNTNYSSGTEFLSFTGSFFGKERSNTWTIA